MSPTLHRSFPISTITLVTVFILLTLYSLRDTKTASDGSLVPLPKGNEDSATNSTSSLLHIAKILWDNAPPSAIAATPAVDVAISSATVVPNEPRRAFVTFLEADTGTNRGDQVEGMNLDDEDVYFVGMLCRSNNLIFSPLTSTSHPCPRFPTHASTRNPIEHINPIRRRRIQ